MAEWVESSKMKTLDVRRKWLTIDTLNLNIGNFSFHSFFRLFNPICSFPFLYLFYIFSCYIITVKTCDFILHWTVKKCVTFIYFDTIANNFVYYYTINIIILSCIIEKYFDDKMKYFEYHVFLMERKN